MDPLARLREAASGGTVPKDVAELAESRFDRVVSGIDRIEGATGIAYPVAYVEPSIVIAGTRDSYGYGILYARTVPLVVENSLRVVIQVCAPLVAYGLKGTIHAILAHEFLHYLELVRRISTMDIVSDEVSGSLFEGAYSDSARLFEPRAVFRDRNILAHITKRFPEGFHDMRLEEKVTRLWIKRGLPRTGVELDSNTLRLSAESISRIRFDSSTFGKDGRDCRAQQEHTFAAPLLTKLGQAALAARVATLVLGHKDALAAARADLF